MDEVPMCFNPSRDEKTLEQKGVKEISVLTSLGNKIYVTLILGAISNRKKLRPEVIFKNISNKYVIKNPFPD